MLTDTGPRKTLGSIFDSVGSSCIVLKEPYPEGDYSY